ncbi:unnamed protein product, partial [Amoebophrya sp. A25]
GYTEVLKDLIPKFLKSGPGKEVILFRPYCADGARTAGDPLVKTGRGQYARPKETQLRCEVASEQERFLRLLSNALKVSADGDGIITPGMSDHTSWSEESPKASASGTIAGGSYSQWSSAGMTVGLGRSGSEVDLGSSVNIKGKLMNA